MSVPVDPPADGTSHPTDDASHPAADAHQTRTRCLHNEDLHTVQEQLRSGEFFWLDLDDPDADAIHALGAALELHALTIDDALTFRQRPKLDDYPGYVFMVVHGVDPGSSAGEHLLREVHVIISGSYVVTIHKGQIGALADLRARRDDTPLRSEQFLIYTILDAITSTFYPVLERIDDAIDDIEEAILANPSKEALQQTFALKRDLVAMRRVITPMRDVFARNVERISDLPGLQTDDELYFRDLYDSTIRISDLVDSYRDLLSGATDMYLSMVANRQGEISKQLTLVATIFLPLSFLTGFFGQNFSLLTNHIIDADWTFWVLGLGLELAAVVGLLWFFRRQHWF